jgi:aryl-phospho-beta-D-glucosidase BglC (GH1 family)
MSIPDCTSNKINVKNIMIHLYPLGKRLLSQAILLGTATLAILATTNSAWAESSKSVEPDWLPVTSAKLPRWRGFNLLEKFQVSSRRPFQEDDFRMIHDLGFNFVRLPMDYRCWIKNGNWEDFDEDTLREIDQAVEWGNKYKIHVSLNFHRAPGYTVASPAEKTSLWTDPETQRVCARHWALFARRYKGIPSEKLSFNLMNEPDTKMELYIPVVALLAKAIRAEDPDRLILSDGLAYGRNPILELSDLHIAQATRGYTPMEISHYKANWVNSENYPYPQWPQLIPPNGSLLSPVKTEGSHPIVFNGPFTVATQMRLHLMTVSQSAQLLVEADGKVIWEKNFKSGPGEGEWKKAVYSEKYKIYQNLYDRDYPVQIPADTQQIKLRVASGDWLFINEIGFKSDQPNATEDVLRFTPQMGKVQPPLHYVAGNLPTAFVDLKLLDKKALWQESIVPWLNVESKGVGVFVGEWGAFNKTPHDVVLKWAEDNLANWKEAHWGWAMWNFRGPFGIIDSERTDVNYEDYQGHKLDRKYLQLLQRY